MPWCARCERRKDTDATYSYCSRCSQELVEAKRAAMPSDRKKAEIQGDILLAKSECHAIATASPDEHEIVADLQDMARNAWEALQRVTDALVEPPTPESER